MNNCDLNIMAERVCPQVIDIQDGALYFDDYSASICYRHALLSRLPFVPTSIALILFDKYIVELVDCLCKIGILTHQQLFQVVYDLTTKGILFTPSTFNSDAADVIVTDYVLNVMGIDSDNAWRFTYKALYYVTYEVGITPRWDVDSMDNYTQMYQEHIDFVNEQAEIYHDIMGV